MKRALSFAFILALLSVPAFAAAKSATIQLTSATTVGTTKLPAGEYKLTWNGAAPNVQVTLVQKNAGHPATATATARLTEQKNRQVALTTNSTDGANALENVQLKDVTLTFTSAPANGQ